MLENLNLLLEPVGKVEPVVDDLWLLCTAMCSLSDKTHGLELCGRPDALCCGEGLHNEVSSATVPGSPLFGLLVEGRDVGLAANGSKQGKGGCAGALHTHVLEDAACSAGLHSFRKHPVGSLVHAAT